MPAQIYDLARRSNTRITALQRVVIHGEMAAQIYDLARRSPVHACMLRCPFCRQIALRALWAKRHLALSVLPANRPAGSLGKKAPCAVRFAGKSPCGLFGQKGTLRCPFCRQIALRALWAKRHLALSVLPANRPAGSLGKKANAKTAALQRIFSVERMEK